MEHWNKIKSKENLSSREWRKAVTCFKENKYKFKDFDELGRLMQLLKLEYQQSIEILSGDRVYTLYNMICYKYINLYNINQITRDTKGALDDLVKIISAHYGNADGRGDHYKSFANRARRRLNRFFDSIFCLENSITQFESNNKKIFSVMDYGLISYLLDVSTEKDMDNFLSEQYNQVSEHFWHVVYVGVRSMVERHPYVFDLDKFETIWFHKFISQLDKKLN